MSLQVTKIFDKAFVFPVFSRKRLKKQKKQETEKSVETGKIRKNEKFRKKRNHSAGQLLGSTIAIISVHVPGLHTWSSAGQGAPKQWKAGWF